MDNRNRYFVVEEKDPISISITTSPPGDVGPRLVDSVLYAYGAFTGGFDELLTVTELESLAKARNSAATEFTESLSDMSAVDNPVTFRDSEGISRADLAQFLSGLSLPENHEPYFSMIECTDSRVAVFLEDGIVEIDTTTSDVYKHSLPRRDEFVDPGGPAITFKMGYSPEGLLPTIARDVFFFNFRTSIDVWFGNSTIERINGARLAECIDRLDDALGIREYDVIETPSTVGPSDVRSLFDYDGPPSAKLIEQFQGRMD